MLTALCWVLGDAEMKQVFLDLLERRQRGRSGVAVETESVTESVTVTENETVTETTSGGIGPALGHVPGPGRGIKGSPGTGPGAEVRVPSKTGRTETSMERGLWTDGGTSTWTALPQRSLPSGTFTTARSPASCSSDASCSWRG